MKIDQEAQLNDQGRPTQDGEEELLRRSDI